MERRTTQEARDPARVLVHRLHSRLGAVRIALQLLRTDPQGEATVDMADKAEHEAFLMAMELTVLSAVVAGEAGPPAEVDLAAEVRAAARGAAMYGVRCEVVAGARPVPARSSPDGLRRLLPVLIALAGAGGSGSQPGASPVTVQLTTSPPALRLRGPGTSQLDPTVEAAAGRILAAAVSAGGELVLELEAP